MADETELRIWVTQLRKGLAEFYVLACLRGGEAYGYELLRRLKEYPGLSLSEGTLYPLLNRAAEAGHVSLEHRPSANGPPRRYYRLTVAGRARLKDMYAAWQELDASITRVWEN